MEDIMMRITDDKDMTPYLHSKKQEFTDAQCVAFKEASMPLIKFLEENCHPHIIAIVDNSSAELLEGVAMFRVAQAAIGKETKSS